MKKGESSTEEREEFLLWRRKNNIILDTVAQYVGCNKSTISRYERGKTDLYWLLLDKYREMKNNYNQKRI